MGTTQRSDKLSTLEYVERARAMLQRCALSLDSPTFALIRDLVDAVSNLEIATRTDAPGDERELDPETPNAGCCNRSGELDGFNTHAVTAHEGKIVVASLARAFDPVDAMNLAAWLVASIGLLDVITPQGHTAWRSTNERLEVLARLVRQIEET